MFATRLFVWVLIAPSLLANQYPEILKNENALHDAKMTIHRLPNTTQPLKYELHVVPYLEGDFKFAGYVIIRVQINTPTNTILLHSKHLTITDIKASFSLHHSLDSNNELLVIASDKKLNKNTVHDVRIEFVGYMKDDMVGLYRSSYEIGNRTKKWLAITQFEPTYARYAFPCYDEPQFKTPFSIFVARKSHETSISNMPVEATNIRDSFTSGGRIWDKFKETPPMSTYLVAFAVFEFKANASGNVVNWMRENALNDGQRVAKISPLLIDLMQTYTGVPYKLPHLQNVAVPDFDFGAMENWGMITYREQRMLYNEHVCSQKNLEDLTATIAHEISHQWFGDLVTPVWWDFLWLNEGFARYFQYVIVAKLEPSWRMNEIYVPNSLQTALFYDQVNGQHPITSSVKTPAEIAAIFDFITYDKGAAILRMLEHMVGTPIFRKALSAYLNEGCSTYNGSVTPDILWSVFENKITTENIHLPATVSQIMEPWTHNSGYPLIDVERTSDNNIKIEQKTYIPKRTQNPISEQEWWVPLTFTKQTNANFQNTTPSHWLKQANIPVLLDEIVPAKEWVIFNIQATGYYRVNYDLQNWELLIEQLLKDHQKIHVLNRAQLIDDAFVLAIDDYISFDVFFRLIKYLDKELDMIPWFTAFQRLEFLYSWYESTRIGHHLKDYIIHSTENLYKHLSFHATDHDHHLTKTGREQLVTLVCEMEFPLCIEDARQEFTKYSTNFSNIQPDNKRAVLCTMVNENKDVAQHLWNLYRESNVAYEKETALWALGCSKNETFLKSYIFKLIDESDTEIRKQDEIYVYRAVFRHSRGVTACLHLTKDIIRKQRTEPTPSISTESMASMINYIARRITTKEQIKILEEIIMDPENSKNSDKALLTATKKARKFGIHQQKLKFSKEGGIESCIGRGRGSTLSYQLSLLLLCLSAIVWNA